MATVLFRRAWELTSTHATMLATMARNTRDHVDEAVGGSVRLAVGGNVLATRRVTYQKGVAKVSQPSRARVASNPYA